LVLIFGGIVQQNGDFMQGAVANDLWAWDGVGWKRLA
jgi:hypothetical protein